MPTSDSQTSSVRMGQGNGGAAKLGVLDLFSGVGAYSLDLARALRVDFQVANHLNEKLKLGLPVRREIEGPKPVGRAVPKPAKKGAGK